MRFIGLIVAVGAISVMLLSSVIGEAASPCPPEVQEAKSLLAVKTKTADAAKASSSRVPRPLASAKAPAARGQDVQAPRGQDVQAPRGQDVQAPRGQDVQAPRGQDVQAPRGQDVQAPRNAAKGRASALANARRLVNDADAACRDADNARAGANARAAIELLKYLP